MDITCDDDTGNACQIMTVYCPTSKSCTINCISDTACNAISVYIPTQSYSGLDLICKADVDDACTNALIYCEDSGGFDKRLTDSWQCSDLSCCPIEDENIDPCPSESDCEIFCNVEQCRNSVIDGSLADSLTLNCTGSTCDGALVICPSADNSSCSIDCAGSSCRYSVIQTAEDNIMDTFSLNCGYDSGCQYLDLQLNSTIIADLYITCSDTYSCRYAVFDIRSIITNDFYLTCSSSGCYGTDINVRSGAYDTEVNWKCLQTKTCKLDFIVFTKKLVINSAYILCNDSLSCNFLDFDASNAIINDLSMDCFDCKDMKIVSEISNSAVINCRAEGACNEIQVELTAITSEVVYDIQCENPAVTTSSIFVVGACYFATFNLYGFSDVESAGGDNANLNIFCNTYDCEYFTINAYDLNSAQIDCTQSC